MDYFIVVNLLAIFAPTVTIAFSFYEFLHFLVQRRDKKRKNNVKSTLLFNIRILTDGGNIFKMLFEDRKSDKVLYLISIALAAITGFIGSSFVDIPYLFVFTLTQYPILLFLVINDVTAFMLYYFIRFSAKIKLEGYSEDKNFLYDLRRKSFSKHKLSQTWYAKGALVTLSYIYAVPLFILIFAFYNWIPLFQNGFYGYINVSEFFSDVLIPIFAVTTLCAFLGFPRDYETLPSTFVQEMINKDLINIKMKVKTQTNKGDPIEEVIGTTIYLRDFLILGKEGKDSNELVNIGWNNVQTYSIMREKV